MRNPISRGVRRPTAPLNGARSYSGLWPTLAAATLVLLLLAACGGDKRTTPTPEQVPAMAVVTPTPGTPPPRTPEPLASNQTYIVKPGDTISTIASRFGVNEDDLERLNHISNPNDIMAGQKLLIPAPRP